MASRGFGFGKCEACIAREHHPECGDATAASASGTCLRIWPRAFLAHRTLQPINNAAANRLHFCFTLYAYQIKQGLRQIDANPLFRRCRREDSNLHSHYRNQLLKVRVLRSGALHAHRVHVARHI
jgi:hypothetical protein